MTEAVESPTSHVYFEAIPEFALEEMVADLRGEGRAIEFGLKETGCCGCLPVIDYDEYLEAQRDERVIALLKRAKEVGARVEREGRRRW